MKTVALISGGKDSCYNMVQCVAEGHDIVALANLRPVGKDELDSYMYQTVGHHAIDLYAEAMDLPLYRRDIQGSSQSVGKDYTCVEKDEVEDLYELLKTVKAEKSIEGVAVGAILSNYQRVRVEHVCSRLGLTPLAYLWRRDQSELLEEMIQCKIDAIIIKVAAMGLTPKKHLGKTLAEMQSYLEQKSSEYDLNVCGEGGEFETFTLDCPLFRKKIVLDETETVLHSDDPIAPVGYLNLRKAHLEDKDMEPSLSQFDLIKDLPMLRSSTLLQELFIEEELSNFTEEELSNCIECDRLRDQEDLKPRVHYHGDRVWITGLVGRVQTGIGIGQLTTATMDRLLQLLQDCGPGWDMSCLALVHLYIRNMTDFAAINAVYKTYFGINPAARVCVQASLPKDVAVQLDCYGYRNHDKRDTMHVQGLSHWAPANIGPYSQCVKIGNCLYVAGQIAMVPSNLSIIRGGIRPEARLSLRHVDRVLSAMCPGCTVNHVITCVCYVTQTQYIPVAKEEWQRARSDGVPCQCLYVVVPMLPKGALIEWQVTALQPDQISYKDYEVRRSEKGVKVNMKCVCCEKEEVDEDDESSTNTQFCSLTGSISKTETGCGASLPGAPDLADLLYQCHQQVLNKAGLKFEHLQAPRFFYPASSLDYTEFYKALETRYGSLPFTTVPVIALGDDELISMSVIP